MSRFTNRWVLWRTTITSSGEREGGEELQRRVRFALYHLIGCADPADRRTAPGARLLTGERYKGHVFWDNELFVVPFLVHTDLRLARAVLGYRYHTPRQPRLRVVR